MGFVEDALIAEIKKGWSKVSRFVPAIICLSLLVLIALAVVFG